MVKLIGRENTKQLIESGRVELEMPIQIISYGPKVLVHLNGASVSGFCIHAIDRHRIEAEDNKRMLSGSKKADSEFWLELLYPKLALLLSNPKQFVSTAG